MKKSDLKNKMVVKTRNGNIYTIIDGDMYRYSGWVSMISYREDLTNKLRDGYDIVEVYGKCRSLDIDDFVKISQPIWKREEGAIEVTMDDIEEKFGQPVKIVKEKEEDTYKMDISSWDKLFPSSIISLNYKGGFIKK